MGEKMPEAQNKKPQRKCVGCNQMKDKSSLLRVVKDKEGNIFLDKTGKSSGRGAYICNSTECIIKCRKGGRLEKALKSKIGDDIYDSLESITEKGIV